MTEFRNLTVRLLQVVWVLGVIFLILACLFIVFMTISGEGLDNVAAIAVLIGGASLAFILLMLSLQYIFFSTYNVNNLFDGSLLQ